MSSIPEIVLGAPVDTTPQKSRVRLGRMFEEHHDFIWRLLRRLGLNAEQADDATQQVFLVAAERVADIRRGSERAFLFGSALRVARALLRRDHRLVLDGDMDRLFMAGASPEELCDRRRALDVMDRALSSMDLELRTVFILFELEGLPMVEIATLMERPLGTVASRLRRAREGLRAALSGLVPRVHKETKP